MRCEIILFVLKDLFIFLITKDLLLF